MQQRLNRNLKWGADKYIINILICFLGLKLHLRCISWCPGPIFCLYLIFLTVCLHPLLQVTDIRYLCLHSHMKVTLYVIKMRKSIRQLHWQISDHYQIYFHIWLRPKTDLRISDSMCFFPVYTFIIINIRFVRNVSKKSELCHLYQAKCKCGLNDCKQTAEETLNPSTFLLNYS